MLLPLQLISELAGDCSFSQSRIPFCKKLAFFLHRLTYANTILMKALEEKEKGVKGEEEESKK